MLAVAIVCVLIVAVLYLKMKAAPPAPPALSLFEQAKKKAEEAKQKQAAAEEDACPAGPMTIYFGSQTGTAEEFAQTLKKEGKSNGFKSKVVDLEDFELEQLQEDGCAVFCVATYGEGDPTDNAIDFFKVIKDKQRELEDDTLANLKFTVFGLGNRQYEKYNEMGRFVNKRLEALGATRVFEYGEGDDDGTLDEDFENWREELWPALRSKFLGREHAASFGEETGPEEPTLQYEVVVMADESASPARIQEVTARARAKQIDRVLQTGIKVDLGSKPYFKAVDATVVSSMELRQSTETTSTRHVEIDLPLPYVTADNLSVCPVNSWDLVESLCERLHYAMDQWFVLRRSAGSDATEERPLFPTPCTVRDALGRYCDLTSTARKSILPYLAYFATDPAEQARLLALASPAGKEEFHAFVAGPRRTVPELIHHFPSVQIPFGHLIELLPRLQARDYTISSSSIRQPGQCSITVSLVNEEKPEGRFHRGVCSNYLADLNVGTQLSVLVKPSSFRLPRDLMTPIIMVGPGTGIAPMRAFLQERQHQKHAMGLEVGRSVLFFGCRRRDEDFIYENELLSYTQDGTLTNLYTAFSREGVEKVYVQHLLAQEGELVFDIMQNQGGYFYVCGGTSMGTDVAKALESIYVNHGQMNAEKAKKAMNDLKGETRFVQELWS